MHDNSEKGREITFEEWIDQYTGKHEYEEGSIAWSLFEDTVRIRKDKLVEKVAMYLEEEKAKWQKSVREKVMERAIDEKDYKHKSGLYEAYDIINNINQNG